MVPGKGIMTMARMACTQFTICSTLSTWALFLWDPFMGKTIVVVVRLFKKKTPQVGFS